MGSLVSKATRLGEQLCKACEEGDLKKVEQLVKAGADLNYKNKVMTSCRAAGRRAIQLHLTKIRV